METLKGYKISTMTYPIKDRMTAFFAVLSLATIANNLQCQDNDPAPTGGGNTSAQKQEQCEEL